MLLYVNNIFIVYNNIYNGTTKYLQKYAVKKIQWNLSITTTYWSTSLPSGAHLGEVAKGHLDELQKTEVFNKSKLVPSVFIKTHY